jgi:DNA gyrase subunit A
VIALIRAASDPEAARAALTGRAWPAGAVEVLIALIDEPGHGVDEDGAYRLSDVQARAILELRLQRLTGLERDKISQDLEALAQQITEYLEILGSRERLLEVLRGEIVDMKERYADPRRTSIEDLEFESDIEDLIQREDMVVTLSHGGYIKRVPLSTYRSQRRGGKGRAGMSTRDEDFVSQVFVCNTHTPVLFFSSRGMVYKLKVYRLPLGKPQARGKALINILPLEDGETITTAMALPEDEDAWAQMDVMFATTRGTVRRNRLSDFTRVMANGKIAMKLEDEGARLVAVQTCTEAHDVLLATADGKCIRFRVPDVRVFSGRNSVGVRGIRLAAGNEIISMSILDHVAAETEERDAYLKFAIAKRRAEAEDAPCAPEEVEVEEIEEVEQVEAVEVEVSEARASELEAQEQFILSISEDGFGKRTSSYEYRVTKRGGQGIGNMDLSRRDGQQARVVAAFHVAPSDQIMLVTDGGQLIRSPVNDIRTAGRTTRGVTLFRIGPEERVVSVARLDDVDEDEDEDEDDNGDENGSEDQGGGGPEETPESPD